MRGWWFDLPGLDKRERLEVVVLFILSSFFLVEVSFELFSWPSRFVEEGNFIQGSKGLGVGTGVKNL